MLRISQDQIASRVDTDDAFAEWYIRDVLRNHFPQDYWALSDESKREMVLNGRSYARSFGLTKNESQARFVTLMWLIGPNFYHFDGYSHALAEQNLTETMRLDKCFDLQKDLAVIAIQGADALFWYPHMVALRNERSV